MRWVEHVAPVWEMKNACKVMAGKSEGKRPLGRPWCRWNYRMDLREIGWESVDWIHSAQDRVRWRVAVNTVISPAVR